MRYKFVATVLSLVLSCFVIAGCNNGTQGDKNKAALGDGGKTPVTETAPGAGNQGATSGGKETGKVESSERIVYVVPSDGTQKLKAVKTKITFTANRIGQSLAQEVLKQNAKNLPAGVKVLGLEVKDGLAKLNLSKEFVQKGQGENALTMTVYALVNTLTEIPEIKKVQFLSEGKPIEVLGQMDLTDPLTRAKDYLSK